MDLGWLISELSKSTKWTPTLVFVLLFGQFVGFWNWWKCNVETFAEEARGRRDLSSSLLSLAVPLPLLFRPCGGASGRFCCEQIVAPVEVVAAMSCGHVVLRWGIVNVMRRLYAWLQVLSWLCCIAAISYASCSHWNELFAFLMRGRCGWPP